MKNKKVYILTGIILIIDIVSKLLVSNLMLENQSIKIINNFFYLTYVKNTGVAFSFLEGKVPLIIMMTIIVVFLIIKYISTKRLANYLVVAYALVLGGAIGNLIDRIIYGYVIDFIDIYIFSYDYPIFNIADSGIVIGIIMILIYSLKKERSDNHEINRGRTAKNR